MFRPFLRCCELRGLQGVLVVQKQAFRASSNDPSCLNLSDVGRLYEVPNSVVETLAFRKILPSKFAKQVDTFGECLWLCRRPFLEVVHCLKSVRKTAPNLRVVLWGKFGTGKSMTMHQAVHYAHSQGWVIFTVRSAMDFTRAVREIQMSSYRTGRIDVPEQAVALLQLFKQSNAPLWKKLSDLKTSKNYEWTKIEKTAVGRPITDIVEMGLSAPFVASDCVGGLLRELKGHASAGSIRVLFAIDDANSLFGKTLVRRADRTFALADDLTLVHHMRKLFNASWSNGACLLVADKKELSDARDKLTIPLNTPLELFGEQGFESIDPFIPIETGLYSKEEMDSLYDYYKAKGWITTENGRSERGRKELKFLSAFNPYMYERLCAFL